MLDLIIILSLLAALAIYFYERQRALPPVPEPHPFRYIPIINDYNVVRDQTGLKLSSLEAAVAAQQAEINSLKLALGRKIQRNTKG